MSYQVKLKVRPNQTVSFPGICVHCAQPASQRLLLHKRMGRVTRLIELPLCTACQKELHRTSADEERLQKIGGVVSGVLLLLTAVLTFLLLPSALAFLLRALTALLVGGSLAWGVWAVFTRARQQAALPTKKAILNSAKMTAFSWRATVFEFSNDIFTERFKRLNEPNLMEVV